MLVSWHFWILKTWSGIQCVFFRQVHRCVWSNCSGGQWFGNLRGCNPLLITTERCDIRIPTTCPVSASNLSCRICSFFTYYFLALPVKFSASTSLRTGNLSTGIELSVVYINGSCISSTVSSASFNMVFVVCTSLGHSCAAPYDQLPPALYNASFFSYFSCQTSQSYSQPHFFNRNCHFLYICVMPNTGGF